MSKSKKKDPVPSYDSLARLQQMLALRSLAPHIHYIVVGGGLSEDHATWHSLPQPDFLLPEAVLAARFRTRLGARLQADEHALHAEIPASVWRADWVVDCEAVGSGATALRYLSAYVFRTAFGSKREITEYPDGKVSFEYVDSKTKELRTCLLERNDFIDRFLQHVLPPGQHRVRYFGWMHPSAKKRRLIVETLLAVPIVVRPKCEPPPAWHRCCPHCGQFTLVVVARLPRGPP